MENTKHTYEELKNYISGERNKAFVYNGDSEAGFGWAGQVVGIIKDEPTVKQLFSRMLAEAELVRERWQTITT